MSGGGVDNLTLSAVQIQAAQLEIQLRESLGQSVDDRLRRIAAAQPSTVDPSPTPQPASKPVETPPTTTAPKGSVPSWLLPIQRFRATDLGHGPFYGPEEFSPIYNPEQGYLFDTTEALSDHTNADRVAAWNLLKNRITSDQIHAAETGMSLIVIYEGGEIPIAVQLIDDPQRSPRY